jgi:hypothetical protein
MIYIAGRIRGQPDYQAIFAEAADRLRAEGLCVFNPAAANQEGRPLHKIMSYVLGQLCECDTIAMLPGWYRSGGARVEWLLARYLKLKIIYL